MQSFGDGRDQRGWSTWDLMAAYRSYRVKSDYQAMHWVAGTRSIGLKGFIPIWERGHLAGLKMLEQIRDKSLDELEAFMAGVSRPACSSAQLLFSTPIDDRH